MHRWLPVSLIVMWIYTFTAYAYFFFNDSMAPHQAVRGVPLLFSMALYRSTDVPEPASRKQLGKWWSLDKTVVDFKQEEHSAIHHYITYSTSVKIDHTLKVVAWTWSHTLSVVSSEPALTFSSVYSTIRVYPVTSGEHENSTFVEWSATFSGDADAAAIQDARYKRKEGLADLAKAACKK
ncbi:hypothetical protein EMMF5_002089 [Cystobasidiomycetes sp. EMM_F5]